MNFKKILFPILIILLYYGASFLGLIPANKTLPALQKTGDVQNVSSTTAHQASCDVVLRHFNRTALNGKIDVAQLSDIIRTLEKANHLPAYFITKKEASRLGWRPGVYFNRIAALKGKSIGGDYFGNFEKRLPYGKWQEADLDYRGKKRNAKRLVFSRDGQRYVTIDHYERFHQVPSCQ